MRSRIVLLLLAAGAATLAATGGGVPQAVRGDIAVTLAAETAAVRAARETIGRLAADQGHQAARALLELALARVELSRGLVLRCGAAWVTRGTREYEAFDKDPVLFPARGALADAWIRLSVACGTNARWPRLPELFRAALAYTFTPAVPGKAPFADARGRARVTALAIGANIAAAALEYAASFGPDTRFASSLAGAAADLDALRAGLASLVPAVADLAPGLDLDGRHAAIRDRFRDAARRLLGMVPISFSAGRNAEVNAAALRLESALEGWGWPAAWKDPARAAFIETTLALYAVLNPAFERAAKELDDATSAAACVAALDRLSGTVGPAQRTYRARYTPDVVARYQSTVVEDRALAAAHGEFVRLGMRFGQRRAGLAALHPGFETKIEEALRRVDAALAGEN